MRVQSILAVAMTLGLLAEACGGSGGGDGVDGSGGNGGSGTGGGGGGSSCSSVTACDGDVTGTWTVSSSCLNLSGDADVSGSGLGCKSAKYSGTLDVKGTLTTTADGKYTDATTTKGVIQIRLEPACLTISGTTTTCDNLADTVAALGYASVTCEKASGGCDCKGNVDQKGSLGVISGEPSTTGKFKAANKAITFDGSSDAYASCVSGGKLTLTPPGATGTVVFDKGSAPTGGTGGMVAGGSGGAGSGGSTGGTTGGSTGGATGGSTGGTGGQGGTGGGTGGTGSGGDVGTKKEGPCDIYAAANAPCVAAFSTVRSLLKSYTGPLYQVRNGSSATNTGTGGELKDIGQTSDGFVDLATQEAFCKNTICTVATIYDQTGNNNHLKRGPKGPTGNGDRSGMDDYESSATGAGYDDDKRTKLVNHSAKAGGHTVYGLVMSKFDGYRLTAVGKGMPTGSKSEQGIYMLADGTRSGGACCWDFGNVTTDPMKYHTMNTIFLGTGYWGKGAGTGPWFEGDFEAGVWAGGTSTGTPGAPGSPPNPENPSMKVPFAFGILKTAPGKYAIRVADISTATDLKTAYDGNSPKAWDNQGGILLGIGADNSNNSWGTFYEGAITAVRPSDATDLAVMKNVQSVGYAKP